MQHDTLSAIHRSLFGLLQIPFLQRAKWNEFGTEVTKLARSLAQYCDYLSAQNKKSRLQHRSPTPVRNLADSLCVKYVKACARDSCLPRFDEFNRALEVKQPYEFMFLNSLRQTILTEGMTFSRA